MSFFESVTQLPEDPIFKLPILFAQDTHPNKVNLGVGSYRDSNNAALVLPSVKKAEQNIIALERNKEYLPIEGDSAFLKVTTEFLFGKGFLETFAGGFFISQSLGGTGALRLGGEFLSQETSKTIFISTPTWPNHKGVFTRAGMNVHFYPYYDETSHRLNFDKMCSSIAEMPPGSTILLHVNCHNPTGIDPSFEQWKELSKLIKKQKIIPFFDFAYQGFVDNPDEDAKVIRYFAAQGHEMLVANSFSKNFGLYGERIGALCVLTQHKEVKNRVASQVKQIIRNNYSNPSLHGAHIIAEILQNEFLKKEWEQDLATMRNRIKEMRQGLINGLEKGSNINWDFLKRQNGFFSFSGLNEEQVQQLILTYGIFMPTNGRINVAGLTQNNIDYVIQAILNVISK